MENRAYMYPGFEMEMGDPAYPRGLVKVGARVRAELELGPGSELGPGRGLQSS
jgi:hypothetical protein